MKRKVWLVLLLSCAVAIPGFLRAQDAPPNVVSLTGSRYVCIQNHPISVEKTGAYKPTSGIDSQASGFRIGGPYVLTNAHTIQSSEAYEVDGKEIPVLKDISPKFDLMLIKLPFAKAVPWIKIADPEVGTMVYAMTNSDGNDKFLVHGFVSKVDDHYLYLQEPTIPGASGSGLVNAKGELVGFFMQDETSTGDIHVPYTEAIPASIVRRFLEQVLPVEDLVKMGITVDTVAEK